MCARGILFGLQIFIEQAAEITGQAIVEHARERSGLRGLDDLQEAPQSMLVIMLLN